MPLPAAPDIQQLVWKLTVVFQMEIRPQMIQNLKMETPGRNIQKIEQSLMEGLAGLERMLVERERDRDRRADAGWDDWGNGRDWPKGKGKGKDRDGRAGEARICLKWLSDTCKNEASNGGCSAGKHSGSLQKICDMNKQVRLGLTKATPIKKSDD